MIKENIQMEEMMNILQNISKNITKIENKINRINNMANSITSKEKEEKNQIKEKNKIKTKKPKLIISEERQEVCLPYTEEDIEYYKQCGYENEEKIAKRFYTVPLKRYSDFAKSRIKERISSNEIQRKSRNNRINKIRNKPKK